MSGRHATSPAALAPAAETASDWRMVWVLGLTELVSWGVLVYSFSVFLPFMQRGLGWQQAQLTGAYSLSVLTRGVAAVGVGWWVDRRGARLLMSAGSLAAGLAVLGWASVHTLAALYLVFAAIGLVSAAVLYEPAFATIVRRFDRRRREAILAVTVLGGLASPVFLPLSAVLADRLGWRTALVLLAIGLAAITAPLHALFVRGSAGGADDGRRASPAVTLAAALRRSPFVWLSAAGVLTSWTLFTVSVHLVTYLEERGYANGVAATVAGLLGLLGIAGRVVLTRFARRRRLAHLTAAFMAAQALALVVLLAAPGPAGLALFVLLFGSAYGVLVVSRTALLADYVPVDSYARHAGMQVAAMTVAQVAAPVVGSLLRTVTRGYLTVLLVAAACSVAAAACILAADRARAAELAA